MLKIKRNISNDWILFMDSDDVACPNLLEQNLNLLGYNAINSDELRFTWRELRSTLLRPKLGLTGEICK